MPTPSSNIPFTYACKLNGSVHLYIVIYAAQRPGYPIQGVVGDETINYIINNVQAAGTNPHFVHYAFCINTITDIKIHYSTHIRKILVEHLDEVDALPTLTDRAFEVPYTYTQIVDTNSFKAELIIFSASAQKYDCTHNAVPGSLIGDTKSAIIINPNSTAVSEFSDSHVFPVQNVLLTDGAHEVTVGDPPKKRRSKTKNRNHSQTPFPSSGGQ
jgi:hypothetical protein